MRAFSGILRRFAQQPKVRFLLILTTITALLTACTTKDENWDGWVSEWKRWETIALQQGWDVTLLKIKPPANGNDLKSLELQAGAPMPHQLRKIMLEHSRGVEFGWRIPGHLQALDNQNMPFASGSRDFLWDLDTMRKYAIPNFIGWREAFSTQTESEAYNSPELWENQFPLSELMNGDMITIDVSDPERQPVRYFSHELGAWHASEIAPDFNTYITERSHVGWAGTEQHTMFRFALEPEAEVVQLGATSPGAVEWIEWATRDPNEQFPDMPPRVILAETTAEQNLLNAAKAGDHKEARKALLSGARPDVAANEKMREGARDWGYDYHTPLGIAVAQNDLKLAQMLLDFGATMNTRHLPMDIAAKRSTLETMKWLIERGARVNGWKYDRYHPLHRLVSGRGKTARMSREEYAKSIEPEPFDFSDMPFKPEEIENLKKLYDDSINSDAMKQMREKQLAEYVDQNTYLEILELLLKSGARPDERWDNRLTMLMLANVEDAKLLLDYGANPNVSEYSGNTVLQYNRKPGMVSLLISRGADINFAGSPVDPKDIHARFATPVQYALSYEKDADKPSNYLKSIFAAGADILRPDSSGSSTLAYVRTLKRYEEMIALGLDPLAKQAEEGTLLHRLAKPLVLARPGDEIWKIADRLLDAGVDINAQDMHGQTALHKLVQLPWIAPATVEALITRGADISIRDANGKLAADLVYKSSNLKKVLALLKT